MADEPLNTAVLTDVGLAKLDAAYQAGTKVNIVEMAFGDANKEYVAPDPTFTQLVNEFGRQTITEGNTKETWINAIVYVDSAKFAGQAILEFGLYDDEGDMIVYSSYTPSVVPAVGKDYIQLEIECSLDLYNASAVTIEVTPIYPQATELERGIAKIATDEDIEAGVDNEKIVTAKKLMQNYISLSKFLRAMLGKPVHESIVGRAQDDDLIAPAVGQKLYVADYQTAYEIISQADNFIDEATKAAEPFQYAGYWGFGNDGADFFTTPNLSLTMHIKSAGSYGNAGETKEAHTEDHAHVTGFAADSSGGDQNIGRLPEKLLLNDGDMLNNFVSMALPADDERKILVSGNGTANGIIVQHASEEIEEVTITGSHLRKNVFSTVVNDFTDSMGTFFDPYIWLPKGEF